MNQVQANQLNPNQSAAGTGHKAHYQGTGDMPNRDGYVNQLNPSNAGVTSGAKPGGYTGTGDKADLDNHGNQINPNHPEYKGNN